MEIRKIQKNGHSLAVNLPPKFATNLGLSEGDFVEISLTVDHSILITNLKPKLEDVRT